MTAGRAGEINGRHGNRRDGERRAMKVPVSSGTRLKHEEKLGPYCKESLLIGQEQTQSGGEIGDQGHKSLCWTES